MEICSKFARWCGKNLSTTMISMRNLNEIVSFRASVAIEAEDLRARQSGRKFGIQDAAKRMSPLMGKSVNTIQHQLARLLRGKAIWALDYYEAFVQAMNLRPDDMLLTDSSTRAVLDHTVAQTLYSGLGRRLTVQQARVMVALGHRALDRPGVYDLIIELCTACNDSNTREEANARCSEIILGPSGRAAYPEAAPRPRKSARRKSPQTP